jgi:DNA topoisomerase-2
VDSSGKKPKKKQTTLKTRKSLTGAKKGKLLDSDDEDDYKPAKAAAAKKAPGKSKPTAVVPSTSSVKIDDDEDVKPAAPAKKRAPAKKPVKAESDSDAPAIVPNKAAKAPTTKKKAYIEESDEEDVKGKVKAGTSGSEMDIAPVVKKPRAPSKRKT